MVQQPPNSTQSPDLSEVSPLHMDQFYRRFFPFPMYYKWLNYSSQGVSKNIKNREFSFTIQNDIYIRYQSFNSEEDFKRDVIQKCPNKIDIGAVYNIAPKLAKTVHAGVMKPLEKELVFDIDMTDYDEIRTCCSGGDICKKCWGWMSVAMKILDVTLKEDFGFKNNLFVYSGRRGVHCWVCDERARLLDNSARKAIVGYLTLIKGGAQQIRKVILGDGKGHPHVQRSLKIANKYFKSIVLESQDILKYPSGWNKILELLPNPEFGKHFDKLWTKENNKLGITSIKEEKKLSENSSDDEIEKMDVDSSDNSYSKNSRKSISVERWEQLEKYLKDKNSKKSKESKWSSNTVLSEIILQFTYPRLDENVSTHLNHLLKSPFCIHPKTGKVCVPIAAHEFDKFDPMRVPTVQQLLNEVDSYDASISLEKKIVSDSANSQKEHKDSSVIGEGKEEIMQTEQVMSSNSAQDSIPDVEKTSLKKYIRSFETFVNRIPELDAKLQDKLSF
ncbi:hypothetical protein BB559_002383 [Furculomyces boomerangus]|uniref:DNA primase n=1 Tax=Furculomyces boomerangus TaxID=61424 RepID=A0A2T9YVU1_9FUNG|nr:hypothetical protein BB559_002383 [Furculomyces boomerangus]